MSERKTFNQDGNIYIHRSGGAMTLDGRHEWDRRTVDCPDCYNSSGFMDTEDVVFCDTCWGYGCLRPDHERASVSKTED